MLRETEPVDSAESRRCMETAGSFKKGTEDKTPLLRRRLNVVCKATRHQARCIKEGLDMFCKVSRQRINYNKSALFVSPNIYPQAAATLNESFGIPLKKELGCYLGHTLVHKGRS